MVIRERGRSGWYVLVVARPWLVQSTGNKTSHPSNWPTSGGAAGGAATPSWPGNIITTGLPCHFLKTNYCLLSTLICLIPTLIEFLLTCSGFYETDAWLVVVGTQIQPEASICLSDNSPQCRMIFISIRLGNFWWILSCHSAHTVRGALSLACHILNTSSNILDRKIFMWQTSTVFLSSLSFDYSTLASWHAKEINYHPPLSWAHDSEVISISRS